MQALHNTGPQISPIPYGPSAFHEDGQLRVEWSRSQDVQMFQTPHGPEVILKVRVLADCLICPLCGGFFRNAAMLKECLHTFCRTCIFRHVITRRSSCPKCSISLEGCIPDIVATDDRMQALVDKLFPIFKQQDFRLKQKLWAHLGRESVSEALPSHELHDSTVSPPAAAKAQSFEALNALGIGDAVQRLRTDPAFVKLHLVPECGDGGAGVGEGEGEGTGGTGTAATLARPFLVVSGSLPVKYLENVIINQNPSFEGRKFAFSLAGKPLPGTQTVEAACRAHRLPLGFEGCKIIFNYKIVEHVSAGGQQG